MTNSYLNETLNRLTRRAASSVVARGRISVPALNAVLLRRLSAPPGQPDSLLADPVFEAARSWESADCTINDLAGGLLQEDLVAALDEADEERLAREIRPWSHQLAAWEAARDGQSFIVSSGTGSGKTECFMIPIIDDLIRDESPSLLVGVRAIIIYPLNALIESQRERLSAWTSSFKDRMRFALYNGLTPERAKQENTEGLGVAEIGNRRQIRNTPPAILVTNVTMLEYLLLRSKDRSILQHSQGLLRWIVLDEAHSYIGAQAAEMALLLRRVRTAFGVQPGQVRLLATSATIGEGDETEAKLKSFVSDLAGAESKGVRVIQGREAKFELPPPASENVLDASQLLEMSEEMLWDHLAPHPRIQAIKKMICEKGANLSEVAEVLFDDEVSKCRANAQTVLDAAAKAKCPDSGEPLLPWRVNLFHRSLGGVWVCVNPSCKHRDPELSADGSGWEFGAIWLKQKNQCLCGSLVFELLICDECGSPHLVSNVELGISTRLVPIQPDQTDEFAVDEEPDNDVIDSMVGTRGHAVFSPGRGSKTDRFLKVDDGTVFDNDPPHDAHCISIALVENEKSRACCPGSEEARIAPQRFGPAFFMGVAMPAMVESLAMPMDKPGLPMGGRRALTFSDSRQGTARLAAKLQQDAERNLTRAFLYHSVQESDELDEKQRDELKEKHKIFSKLNIPSIKEDIRNIEEQLRGENKPIPWRELINNFARHREMNDFCTEVWCERAGGGREMAQDPVILSEMFLYRELLRRPKVQNNAETMGLVRLAFPNLERKAKLNLPNIFSDSALSEETWVALALAAIDFVFRQNLATRIEHNQMMRFISPRSRKWLSSICRPGLPVADRPEYSQPWPGPIPHNQRPSRLHRLVYSTINGNPTCKIDQDRAAQILSALWDLIVSTVATDSGGGAFQLDFRNAAVARIDNGWLCPVTRRIFGYSVSDMSPYDPDRRLKPIKMPRLPHANPGGLDPNARHEISQWCNSNDAVLTLRQDGLWTDLHDRAAAYAPFLRSQEHSAQIERPVLASYENQFKTGTINLLNCSTTMEMGIDIPNVQLVANGNAPPSISNYRQRLGRAGRRGESWAFGVTFCRDLPFDRIVFENPKNFLRTSTVAPTVKLDSQTLVARHVHAALLGAFLRDQKDEFSVLSTTGQFFGASDNAEFPISENAPADKFIRDLRGEWSRTSIRHSELETLTNGTAFDLVPPDHLTSMTAEFFERLLHRWCNEYREIISHQEAATEPEVRQAFSMRGLRMRGEFLLAELARRGFTPSYGFPVDVVTFDHISGHERSSEESESISFGDRRGGASRTLDMAIREYAPGTEVVVDGLVHRSEGVLPAWKTMADASQLEDLQRFWECSSCRAFGLTRLPPEACPECNNENLHWKQSLKPAGFLGRRAPHTGYENLGHAPFELPRLSASSGTWRAMPTLRSGRYRADTGGQIVTLGSGRFRHGYALCLECGRAEDETEEGGGIPLPRAIKKHLPLASIRRKNHRGKYCPGGFTRPERIQRNVRFIHESRTDVFEFQLPAGTEKSAGLALAAGLREALAEKLGAEAREIGVTVDTSIGPANERLISAYLFDRASGGAGLCSRLAEAQWLKDCLNRASQRLSCNENCSNGCPACVLRPDINYKDVRLNRIAGLDLSNALSSNLDTPEQFQVFGQATQMVGCTLQEWIDQKHRTQQLTSVTIFLHGSPTNWELANWPVEDLFRRLKTSGTNVEIVLDSRSLTDRGLGIAQKLDLYRLSANTSLGLTAKLPFAKGLPVLSSIETQNGRMAVALATEVEAMPGSRWGLGEEAPLVCGVAAKLPKTTEFSGERLIEIAGGNARMVRISSQLDGSVSRFGFSFWKLLEAADPLLMASVRAYGISKAVYRDRYLLTPLNLRLLFEVVRKIPGSGDFQFDILTARAPKSNSSGWAVFHSFTEDRVRQAVLKKLFPEAHVTIQDKSQLPHERCLGLVLGDGRKVTILLDQGFGAWRARGAPRHDFHSEPAEQGRIIEALNCRVEAEMGRDVPIVLELEDV